jgi:hypothetical protein
MPHCAYASVFAEREKGKQFHFESQHKSVYFPQAIMHTSPWRARSIWLAHGTRYIMYNNNNNDTIFLCVWLLPF